MIVVGVDVGSLFTKIAVLDEDELIGTKLMRTTGNISDQLEDAVAEAVREAGIAPANVAYMVATGSGADLLSSAAFSEKQINCVAVAASHYLPGLSAVVNLGGQSVAAMRLDDEGNPTRFLRNDKCASGSGRFIEMMANKLLLSVEEIDPLVKTAQAPVSISSQCAVFAESEVIGRINDGFPSSDIMAAVCRSVADMVVSQARRLGDVEHYSIVGGVSMLDSVVERICEKVAGKFHRFPYDPRFAAAIGAALLTAEEA